MRASGIRGSAALLSPAVGAGTWGDAAMPVGTGDVEDEGSGTGVGTTGFGSGIVRDSTAGETGSAGRVAAEAVGRAAGGAVGGEPETGSISADAESGVAEEAVLGAAVSGAAP